MGLHFDLSSEQQALATSVRGLFARAAKGNGEGDAPTTELGVQLGKHGIFELLAPEAAGGLGLGLTDALAIAAETGRAQIAFPVIETMVAANLIGRLRPADAEAVLPGAVLATCAIVGGAELDAEGSGRHKLRGTVTAPFADRARWLAVPVRRNDRNEPGPWAAIIDLAQPGASVSPLAALDLTYPLYRIELDSEIEAGEVVQHELQAMLTVLAAGELAGAAAHCLDASVKHLKERTQFGKLIGTNQVLRHVAADDWVAVQGMLAASEYAAAAFDASHDKGDGAPLPIAAFRQAVHVAKAYCSGAARTVAEHSVQVHGGIGFTWEFGLHIPLRRILRLAASLGTAADHYDTLAASLLPRDTSSERI